MVSKESSEVLIILMINKDREKKKKTRTLFDK